MKTSIQNTLRNGFFWAFMLLVFVAARNLPQTAGVKYESAMVWIMDRAEANKTIRVFYGDGKVENIERKTMSSSVTNIGNTYDMQVTAMNEMGKSGWEFVGQMSSGAMAFKRPLAE
jgi:hypothetical protein